MKPATTAVSRPDAGVWITKEEAAKILAVSRNGRKPQPISARRILEFTQMNVLRSAKQRDPHSGQMMTVVSAADVERFRQERANPVTLPAVPNEPSCDACMNGSTVTNRFLPQALEKRRAAPQVCQNRARPVNFRNNGQTPSYRTAAQDFKRAASATPRTRTE